MRILADKKILNILRCPICKSSVRIEGNSIKCLGERTHCYDFSASGYVNLCSPKQSGGGDSKEAVRARSLFLNKDFYLPVAQALCDIVDKYGDRSVPVLDAGCGEGYYGEKMAEEGHSVFGVDLSKFAVDAAAKRFVRNKRENGFFATASVFELPVFESSVGVVTSVFAPCAEGEFSRVLRNGGILAVVWAGEEHLMGLKKALYDETHTNSERADLPINMEKLEDVRVKYTLELSDASDILSLFSMTPYYWRTSYEDAEKLVGLSRLVTEIDMIISVYKNTKGG